MRTLRRFALLVSLPFAASAASSVSCGDSGSSDGSGGSGASAANGSGNGTESSGTAQGGSGQGGDASSGTTSTSGPGTYSSGVGGAPTEIAECQGHVYACGDIVDNDMDGLIDWQDPDCLGPCDNTEDSYFGGIPGQNNAPCKQDCYWDQDGGSGNDECYWSHECDTHEVDPDWYPEPHKGDACAYAGEDEIINPSGKTCGELHAQQSDVCATICGPLTPNGCDCFGCCELPAGSGEYVWVGSTGPDDNTVCTIADIGDPTKCHPCRPVAGCLNDCDPCELCIGKPEPDPGCNEGGGGQGGGGQGGGGNGGQCPPGVQACGISGQAPCPSGYYCITGCCQAVPE